MAQVIDLVLGTIAVINSHQVIHKDTLINTLVTEVALVTIVTGHSTDLTTVVVTGHSIDLITVGDSHKATHIDPLTLAIAVALVMVTGPV